MKQRSRNNEAQQQQPPALKFAEWVTMAISLVLVLGIAGYLAVEATREQTPLVPVYLELRPEGAQQVGDGYILPLETINRGDRTLHRFRGHVTWTGHDGRAHQRDIEVNYIGERASQLAYIVTQQDPRSLSIQTEIHSYLLD